MGRRRTAWKRATEIATIALASVAFMTIGAAARAEAQSTITVQTGAVRHPFFVGGGIGVGDTINNNATFNAEESLGYHLATLPLAGRTAAHVFASAALQQRISVTSIYSFLGRGGIEFELWNPGNGMGFLLTPLVSAGVAAMDLGGQQGNGAGAAFQLEAGLQGELLLADGMIGIWLRPLSGSMFLRPENTLVNYDMLGGVHFRI